VRYSELIGAVRRHPVWRDASEQGIRGLIAESQDTHFLPREPIMPAGAPAQRIHLLLEGLARAFYPARVHKVEITVRLFWAPATFGDGESILKATWASTIEALVPCRVLITPAPAYFRLMQREPSVCFRQYWDVARRHAVTLRTERAANLDDLEARVIAILISYANRFGVDDPRGRIIDHPLTQEQIGVQVGTNLRNVVRVLTRLYRAKLVLRVGRRYAIPSLDRLIAACTSPALDLSFRSDDLPWADAHPRRG
jgi:CRP-like cAMP-binding protein